MTKLPVIILGARSDIGIAVAHKFAAIGHPIQLAARNVTSLNLDKIDIELRYGVDVSLHEFDAQLWEKHENLVATLPELPGIAVSTIGLLGSHPSNECDIRSKIQIMRVNYEGPASILSVFANHFANRGSGILVGISSVAGERGRASNYIYGSAKAGFTAFLSGLRNRMLSYNVHVVTVIPGFVDTKMTEDLNLPERLTASPVEVAEAIVKAVSQKRNVIYVRKIWRPIMWVIKSIPEIIFKRLKL